MAASGNVSSGWYYGWNVVAVCVLAGIAASALPINAFSLFLDAWTAQLHVPVSTLQIDRKSTRLNSSHNQRSRMPSSA